MPAHIRALCILKRVEGSSESATRLSPTIQPIDSIGQILAEDRSLPFPHEIMMFSCYMGFGWHIRA